MFYASVVRIFATTQARDYDCPWQSKSPTRGSGSGVVIGENEILTGAHVVADATFLQVQKVSKPHKYIAVVEAICHDCDLALLRIQEPNFMEGVIPQTFGDLPNLRDRVSVVGYPVGGEEISVTEGVVSSIEVQRYSHSERSLLAVTVDAAINRGNSGGPVFKDNKVVGIAFQALRDAENVGELVPVTNIRRFLQAHRSGRCLGQAGLGIRVQRLENPCLRDCIGLAPETTGVLVSAVEYGNSAYGILQPGDALTALGGHAIANNGTINYLSKLRTHYGAVLNDMHIGDSLPISFVRDGVQHEAELTLRPLKLLVPRWQYDQGPTYFIFGGLVFQTLCLDYLATWSNWWETAPPELLWAYHDGLVTKNRQSIIVLNQVLADEVNLGYESLDNEMILSINGTTPRDMHHFIELVEAADSNLHMVTCRKNRIVLDAKLARQANERILSRYHVGWDRAAHLRHS